MDAFNTLRPRQNGRHFTDDIFKCILLNENAWISLKISLKLVPKFQINNIPALVQIMAWRRPGDKPISELMIVILLTRICVTRPQWVNSESGLVQSGNKPLPEPILTMESLLTLNGFVQYISRVMSLSVTVSEIPRNSTIIQQSVHDYNSTKAMKCWIFETEMQWRAPITKSLWCAEHFYVMISEDCHVTFNALQWRHNGHDGVSNHQPHDCLLSCLFRRRSTITSKLSVTVLCGRNSPVTGEFPTQMASNSENISIWWRYHARVIKNLPRQHLQNFAMNEWLECLTKRIVIYTNFMLSYPKSLWNPTPTFPILSTASIH